MEKVTKKQEKNKLIEDATKLLKEIEKQENYKLKIMSIAIALSDAQIEGMNKMLENKK